MSIEDRLHELGIDFDVQSMVWAVTHSRHEDMELFYDRKQDEWVCRWWHDPDADPEEEWGAIMTGSDIGSLMREVVHGMFFS